MNPGSLAEHERFTRWVEDHGRAVRGYVRALVRRTELAEDLTQEVFRRAWQARGGYQEQGTPRAYLLRIADRLVCDWSRRNERRASSPDDDDGGQSLEAASRDVAPERIVLQAEEQARLRLALEQLAPLQQRVLLLRYYGDLGFVEIARTMGIPVNTALSHCHRGLLALRKILAETIG